MNIINVTPHPITMQDWEGNVYTVEPCGVLINACPVEEAAGTHLSGAKLVRTRFEADPTSEEALARLERENPGAVIVGSIIAAQAFPGRVFAMVPVPGFERVPPAEKRMRDDKFSTFGPVVAKVEPLTKSGYFKGPDLETIYGYTEKHEDLPCVQCGAAITSGIPDPNGDYDDWFVPPHCSRCDWEGVEWNPFAESEKLHRSLGETRGEEYCACGSGLFASVCCKKE